MWIRHQTKTVGLRRLGLVDNQKPAATSTYNLCNGVLHRLSQPGPPLACDFTNIRNPCQALLLGRS